MPNAVAEKPSSPNQRKLAVIYCRVSSDDQVRGFSLSSQKEINRAYAERLGYEVAQMFVEEGESARTTRRSQLQQLLAYCTKNHKDIGAVIVYMLDRLSRNVGDYQNLINFFAKLGIEVKSATEHIEHNTAAGKLTSNMLASVAQFGSDQNSERTRAGMLQALKEGRWVWPVPRGFRFEKRGDKKSYVIWDEKEAVDYAQDIWQTFEKGIYNQVEVINIINKRGYRWRLTKQSLSQILRNPLYAGLIRHRWLGDTVIKAIHKPLISEETFCRVQAILDGKHPTATTIRRNHPDFPLRNFVRCELCGQKLTGSWSRSHTKKRYAYYHCRTRGCAFRGVRTHYVEGAFVEKLDEMRPSGAALGLFTAIVEDVWKEQTAEATQRRNRVEVALRELEDKKSRIEDLVIRGVFDQETYEAQVERIRQERMARQLELHELGCDDLDMASCLTFCKSFLVNLSRLWSHSGLDLRQRVQCLIFPDGITYGKNDRGGSVRTASISPIFKLLQQEIGDQSRMAPRGGFEPPTC